MSIPEFFVIGALKSGTTALHYMLRQHRQLFLHPIIKETNFFAPDSHFPFRIKDRIAYEDLFLLARADQKIGEVSPSYLFSEMAAGLIRREVPHAKLVALLRDPAERAFSDFMMHVRDGRRKMADLRPQIEREIQRQLLQGDRPILPQGLYAKQLQRFWNSFPRDGIKVILHSDLKRDPLTTVNEVFDFLGVKGMGHIEADTIYNVSGIPKSMVVQNVINRVRRKRRVVKRIVPPFLRGPAMRMANKNLQRPALEPEVRSLLVAYYRTDILMLEDEIGRDLSGWLRC
jgi:hypothetical protein